MVRSARVRRAPDFLPTLGIAGAVLALSVTGCAAFGAAEAPTRSPLQEYLAPLDAMMSDDKLAEINRSIEDAVAECMKAKGFEYTPFENGTTYSVSEDGVDPETGLRWDSREYAERYGYGMSTLGFDSAGDALEDPNRDYVDSLSESAREAYNRALYGEPPAEEDSPSAVTEYDWRSGGCYGQAQHQAGDWAHAYWQDPEFIELTEQMSALYEPSDSPEQRAAQTAWSECMSEGGHPNLEAQPDARDLVMDRMSEELFPEDSAAADFVEPTAEERQEFSHYEIDVALDDFDCSERSGVKEVMKREQFERERVFVEEHRAELDALLARYVTS